MKVKPDRSSVMVPPAPIEPPMAAVREGTVAMSSSPSRKKLIGPLYVMLKTDMAPRDPKGSGGGQSGMRRQSKRPGVLHLHGTGEETHAVHALKALPSDGIHNAFISVT
jgi:hypothetical protein